MTTKIAVSLPDDQVAAARIAVAEGRAPSVSAYVSEALARRSTEDELLQLLDEDEAAGTPTTEEHQAWARQALGLDQPPPADAERPARRSTRTAKSGRYISKGTATRHPSTTVVEATSSTRRRRG